MTKKKDHHCHAMGCSTPCKPQLLMCPAHWRMVPKALKQEVYKHYQPGQVTGQVTPSKEWHTAANAAIQAVFDREQGHRAMRRQRLQEPELFGSHMHLAAELDQLRRRLAEWENQAPVARLLHWIGPSNRPGQPMLCARTYEEFSEIETQGHWAEGRRLYTAPESTPPPPQQLEDIQTVTLPLEPSMEHLCSIAMRYRHDFGLMTGLARESVLGVARQMYEEVTGQGFFKLPEDKNNERS